MVIRGGLHITHDPSIAQLLTFPNPFEPEEEFLGYSSDGKQMVIPRNTLDTKPEACDVVSSKIKVKVDSSFQLRDYQEAPVATMIDTLTGDHAECLLTAKPGSGKSFTLAFVIEAIKERTLILAHLSMLTVQMAAELSANLKGDVVIIDGSNQELGDVNICTFQYLHTNPEVLYMLSQNIGMVVVDEAENMLSETRMNVFYTLSPKYQLLMTATPSRDLIGRTPMIKYMVGDNVVCMESDQHVARRHVMLDYRHLRFMAPTNKMMYKSALTRFFMRSQIPQDTVRLIQELVKGHGCVWVIVDSLKLQDHIVGLLQLAGLGAEVIRGATSAKERKRILKAVADKECRVLLGSAPLSAGISIPELGYAFRLMPNSSSHELLIQQEGRLGRQAPFKDHQNSLWFDYAIEGGLAYNGKKRFKFYKELGDCTFGRVETIQAKLKELIDERPVN